MRMPDKKELPGLNPFLLGIILLSLAAGAVLYKYLPERVPIHWNVYGEVDRYGGRFMGAFGLPLTTLATYLLMVLVPRIDPKRSNYTKFSGAYSALMAVFVAFMLTMHIAILLFTFGYNINIGVVVQIGVGLVFLIIGNYMTRFRHNYFIGIKTPWTLANETVWRKTHRLGGIMFVIAGLLIIVSVVTWPELRFIITITAALGVSLIPMVYSYLLFRKLEG
jgi:uncharacterized membrane protein